MMEELKESLQIFEGAKYLMLTNVQTKKQSEGSYFTIFLNNENTLNEMNLILVELMKEYDVIQDGNDLITIVSKDENHTTLTLFDYTQGVIE